MSRPNPSTVPDILLVNGLVFTAVADRPYAQAVAITGDRISAVGTTEGISGLAGATTRVIDVGDRLIIPGFNDAHTHTSPDWIGRTLDFGTMEPSCKDVLQAVSDSVKTEPPGTVITGHIGATAFFDPECTPAKLTEIAPDHPVMLSTWTPHAAIMNKAMTAKLGVGVEEPPVLGGFFGKSMRESRWDGVVHEYAAMCLYPQLHDRTTEVARLREMLANCVRWGITSIQLMSLPTDSTHLVNLLTTVDPPIRVRIIPMPLTSHTGRMKPEYPTVPSAISDRVRVDGLKWLIDGTPVERSGAQRQPYIDEPGWRGATTFSRTEMHAIMEEVRGSHTQLMVHSAGDGSTEAFLASMEETGGPDTWGNRRVRIEHGNGIMPDLIPRARMLGVVVVVNPTHHTLVQLSLSRFGREGAKARDLIRSLLKAGILLAIGSDGEMNPFLNVMLASAIPMRPDESLTREEAIIAYTASSAYAEFEEGRKGTLEPGKLADIAVLSQNILTIPTREMPKTQSLLTIVGGKIVYDALTSVSR
ncbi:MAG: amidohydrolase family protein [Nitrososphaerota archaeon]|nr:amidohydrolase family protein [Nitrososphaerota archaeon]